MAIIIQTSGDRIRNAQVSVRSVPLTATEDDTTLDFLYKAIGCSCVDLVRLPHDIDMWVDDEGMFKEFAWVNPVAAALRSLSYLATYGRVPCCGFEIYGTAVLTGHDAEGNTVDLTDGQVAWLETMIGKAVRNVA